MPLLPRVVVIAVLVAACGEDSASDDESTSTGPAADDTTESSSTTGPDFLECEGPLLDDIGLELTILPPFTPADDVGVQYSGACTVSAIDMGEPTVVVIDLACTGEGGPQAEWAITARVTWTGGALPLSLAPMSEVDVAIAHSAIDGQLDSIAIHAEDDLVFVASSGQMLALGGDQDLWTPLVIDAPADQMCAEEPDECSTSARNRLVFDGLSGTAIDVFDHHAVATGSYDILVGRALTPVGAECDGGGPGWYDFIVLRTGG